MKLLYAKVFDNYKVIKESPPLIWPVDCRLETANFDLSIYSENFQLTNRQQNKISSFDSKK